MCYKFLPICMLKGNWRINASFKTRKIQQQLGSDSFAHISSCTLCQWDKCVVPRATACASRISILPCTLLPLSHSPRLFLMHLGPVFCSHRAHSAEAQISWGSWISYLFQKKEEKFLSCCSVSKRKTARNTTLLPLSEGETFESDVQWGQIQKVLAVAQG